MLSAGGLGSLLRGLLCKAAWVECPYDMAASFPQSGCFKKEQGGIWNAFYDPASEVIPCCFHLILFVNSDSLRPVGILGMELGSTYWRYCQSICRLILDHHNGFLVDFFFLTCENILLVNSSLYSSCANLHYVNIAQDRSWTMNLFYHWMTNKCIWF